MVGELPSIFFLFSREFCGFDVEFSICPHTVEILTALLQTRPSTNLQPALLLFWRDSRVYVKYGDSRSICCGKYIFPLRLWTKRLKAPPVRFQRWHDSMISWGVGGVGARNSRP